jgi:hypothetical protein
MKNNKIWITVPEAAKKFDVSTVRVYQWAREGRLDSIWKYNRVLINEDAERPEPMRTGELKAMTKAQRKRECRRYSSNEYDQKKLTGIAAALRRSRG